MRLRAALPVSNILQQPAWPAGASLLAVDSRHADALHTLLPCCLQERSCIVWRFR